MTEIPDLEVKLVPTDSLIPYLRNARTHSENQIAELAASVREFGWTNPLLVDGDNGVIAGHGRLMAARKLGLQRVPVIELAHLSENQKRLYILQDNKSALNAGWDIDLLRMEMSDFKELELDLSLTGFSDEEISELFNPEESGEKNAGALVDRFLLAPFSVLNAREGWWQERKRGWHQIGIASGEGRQESLTWQASDSFAGKIMEKLGTTSLFDPVLTEMAYRWFSPVGGVILDPFAGGSVRGVVAAKLGRQYVGVDLRPEQVNANVAQWDALEDKSVRLPVALTEVVDDFMPELTPVESHGGYLVKRDDLFVVGGGRGGKVRTCWSLAQGASGLVTAGSRASPQVNIVASIAKRLGAPCRAHTPQGELSAEVALAEAAGAEIIQHPAGYNSVIIARAREDAKSLGWREIPFGMECEEAITQTRGQVRNIPADTKRLVMPVGSGMSLAGVLWGLVDNGLSVPVLGVRVGADPEERLDRYAPPEWRKMVRLVDAGLDYHASAPVRVLGDLRLDPIYEAKCLPFLKKGDLLWVVGLRASETLDDLREVAPDPQWRCGDSREIDRIAADVEADAVFSCPPYADLEVYSDDPQDISTMGYADFMVAYREIIAKTCERLKQNRFACFVVGEVRDPKGFYRDFVGDTVQAFRDAGLEYYNEAILVTAVGSLPIRAGRAFAATRKLGRTHQNVLVFVKGDPRLAALACGDPLIPDIVFPKPSDDETITCPACHHQWIRGFELEELA